MNKMTQLNTHKADKGLLTEEQSGDDFLPQDASRSP